MLERKPLFPHVIEMNFQAGELLGCNVYLVFDGPHWALVDIGYEDNVDEIIELITAAGKTPAERDSFYNILRVFDRSAAAAA